MVKLLPKESDHPNVAAEWGASRFAPNLGTSMGGQPLIQAPTGVSVKETWPVHSI